MLKLGLALFFQPACDGFIRRQLLQSGQPGFGFLCAPRLGHAIDQQHQCAWPLRVVCGFLQRVAQLLGLGQGTHAYEAASQAMHGASAHAYAGLGALTVGLIA